MSGSDDAVAVVDDGAADVEPAKVVVLLQGTDVGMVSISGHLAAHDVLIDFRTSQSHCTTCTNNDDNDDEDDDDNNNNNNRKKKKKKKKNKNKNKNVHLSCAHQCPERSHGTY